jgi:predicted aldo/keto reductase-like oxidoreductase
MSKRQTRHGTMPLSDSPSSDSADTNSEEAPAWFRMEMDEGITKIQETLSEHLSKIDVLVDKLHEDQIVTKGRVTKLTTRLPSWTSTRKWTKNTRSEKMPSLNSRRNWIITKMSKGDRI